MPETDNLKINDDKLLSERNGQLKELLEFIYDLNNQSGREEIFELSTSFQWIMDYLFESHCAQRNPVDIFNISTFVMNENNMDYYYLYFLKFRATIYAQLKKKGDVVEFLNGELSEDEIFSPTFEEIILLWCLEKIDPDLPELIKQSFSGKLQGSVTLKDLQAEIFHVIPEILENIKSNDQYDIVQVDDISGDLIEENNHEVSFIVKYIIRYDDALLL